jgi:2-polyprenyl-3-methyl-5-hydroxy-6-metoxy-1,4-benzoquinol methylase
MDTKKKKYYDLDSDPYLTPDYYDNLAKKNKNFVGSFVHRKRYELINNLVNRYYKKSKIIIDLACGNCSWNENKLPVIGVDYSKRMLEYAKKKGRITKAIIADVTKKTSIEQNFADILILTETLEHFLNPSLILKEAHRILRPEGKMIVSVPYDSFFSLWKPLFALLCFYQGTLRNKVLYKNKCGHVQNFSPKSLRTLLEKNGFKVLEQHDIFRFIQFALVEKSKVTL